MVLLLPTVTLESNTTGSMYLFYFSQKHKNRYLHTKNYSPRKQMWLLPVPEIAAVPGQWGTLQMTCKWWGRPWRAAVTVWVPVEEEGGPVVPTKSPQAERLPR